MAAWGSAVTKRDLPGATVYHWHLPGFPFPSDETFTMIRNRYMHFAAATLCGLLISLSTPIAAATATTFDADSQAKIEARINLMLKEWKVPGAAVAIVKDDEIILAEGFGELEIGTRRPVDSESLFAIGSASKAFTAAAMAMLVDEGKVAWNDRVIDHLPWFQMYDPYVTREIRICDLLAHDSGLSRGDRVWYGTGLSREEIVRRARYLEPAHSFRSTFEYNNTMFIAAGLVIEAISGQSWDEFVTERILKPLDMNASNTTITALQGKPNVITPHMNPGGKATPAPWRNIDNAGPAGSINSNVVDMAQWVRLMLGNGEYEGKRLISEANVQEMTSSQMKMTKSGGWAVLFADSSLIAYGLGWFLAEHQGHLMVNHGGNIDGNAAFVSFIPDADVGIVVLSNLNQANGFITAVTYEIYDVLLGAEFKDWNQQLQKAMAELEGQGKEAIRKANDARVANTRTTLPLDQYAGNYTNQMYPDVVVESTDKGLQLTYAGAFKAWLEHWNYDTFVARWEDVGSYDGPPSLVRFAFGTDGKVYKVHVDLEGSIPFEREKPKD
jgi:CubicO group peptidase (beta-lactamase class C family)